MNNIIDYAIKSGIALTVLYLFYWFVLRKTTHHKLNRVILLTSICISMIIPFVAPKIIKAPFVSITIPSIITDSRITGTTEMPESYADDMDDRSAIVDPSTAPSSHHMNFLNILLIVYLIGALIIFARLIYQGIYLRAVANLSKKKSYNKYVIISMNTETIPFSYFRRIFIPADKYDEDSLDGIIEHEKTHLKQFHFIDLFLIEIICIVQWFNPVIWLFERAIKEVHEYLADEAILNSGRDPGKYQALLVNQALGGPVFILSNQFNQSLIKKRIIMMKNKKKSQMAKIKALFIVPLIAGLLLTFANQPIKSQSATKTDGKKITVSGIVLDRASGEALPGCAVIIKGTTTGTTTDINGNYQIDASSTDKLVISLVGFRTQVIAVDNNTKINVLLEQDILVIDFDKGNKLALNEKPTNTPQKKKIVENSSVIVEDLPAYPGGTDALQKYLQSNLRYPEKEKKEGIHGIVMVTYVINNKGEVTGAKVLRGLTPDIDKEALRLTNTIKGWQPATQNGKPIVMLVQMPIKFGNN